MFFPPNIDTSYLFAIFISLSQAAKSIMKIVKPLNFFHASYVQYLLKLEFKVSEISTTVLTEHFQLVLGPPGHNFF